VGGGGVPAKKTIIEKIEYWKKNILGLLCPGNSEIV